MLAGLALLVVSVRLSTPNLAMFLIAGALIGAGSGAVFKGTTGIVLGASPPESRVAMTSDLLIALYVGLAVPVIGAGVALDLGASAPNTVLGFGILVGLGVVVSGWALLRRLALRLEHAAWPNRVSRRSTRNRGEPDDFSREISLPGVGCRPEWARAKYLPTGIQPPQDRSCFPGP